MMYNDTYTKQADVSQSEREPVTAQSMEYYRSDAMWRLRLDHRRFPLGCLSLRMLAFRAQKPYYEEAQATWRDHT